MENLIEPLSLLFLRDNNINLQLVGASLSLDKDALVRAHSFEAQRSSEFHGRGFYAVYRDDESLTHGEVGAQNSLLRPIRLKDMKVGVVHNNRVLRGKLCVEPYKALAVGSVLEQDDGMCVRIRVYNTTCHSADEARRVFFMGASVEVRDPHLMLGLDGCLLLYVSHPSFLRITSPVPSCSVEAETALFGVERYWVEGKNKMTSGDYSGAITAYSKCIGKLRSHGAEEHHNQFPLHLALSNRAEAFLRSQEFEKALCDVNMALDVDSSHAKSLFRRGRALLRLHEYAEAINCFEKLSLMSPTVSGQVKEELEKAKRMNEQSIDGNHCFFDNPLDRREQENLEDLEFGEYIGSAALRDGRLYATREIKNGETIMVTNGIAVMDLSSPISSEKMIPKCIGVVKSSNMIWMQLNALALPDMSRDVMALFRPNTGRYDSMPFTNESNVDENVVSRFVVDNLIISETPSNRVMGIWLLPSIISHSCTPNSSMIRRGKAMFVHAARDIHADQEITTCSIGRNIMQPLKIREKELKFFCKCERCVFERSVRKLLRQIVREHEALCCYQFGNVVSFATQMLRVAVKVEKKLRGCPHFTDERKRWIRASFTNFYITPYLIGVYGSSMPPIETILDAIYATDPSSDFCLGVALKAHGSHLCLEREDLGNPLIVEMLKSRFGRRDGRIYRQIARRSRE